MFIFSQRLFSGSTAMSTFSPSAPSAAYSHMHMSQVHRDTYLYVGNCSACYQKLLYSRLWFHFKRGDLFLICSDTFCHLRKYFCSFRVTEVWELLATSPQTWLRTTEICAVLLPLVIIKIIKIMRIKRCWMIYGYGYMHSAATTDIKSH